ncbi:MAG TPA: hypothetical protein VEA37_02035 [Flavobacterium sp.]|nr:hypothetical protein [Flavobacterium sp.]
MRNIFTGLLFNTSSNDICLPIGSAAPTPDYRMQFGYIVGEKRVVNAGNAVVAEYRLNRQLAGK